MEIINDNEDEQKIEKNTFEVNVSCYNLLTQSYCTPDRLPKANPEHISFQHRWNLIKAALQQEIDKKSIICLQEVSMKFCSNLASFFQQRNYFYLPARYGDHNSNYMGVAIAFPQDIYNLETAEIVRLSDTKRWPRSKTPPPPSFLKAMINHIKNIILWFLQSIRLRKATVVEQSPWDVSKWKHNQFISMKLSEKVNSQHRFYIGNYHMPCDFRRPKVMTIHAALAAQYLQRVARSTPYILCGDFNLKPDSPQYKLLTTAEMDENHSEYPNPIPDDENWRPKLKEPLKSSYAVCNGSEPMYTNKSHPSDFSPDGFVGTLDYIFYSKGCSVMSVLELPDLGNECIPSESQPSDHLKIAACISIRKSKKE